MKKLTAGTFQVLEVKTWPFCHWQNVQKLLLSIFVYFLYYGMKSKPLVNE